MAAAAVLTLVAHVGIVVMIQGVTRYRSVSTSAARHVAQFAAAVLAFSMVGFALGFGPGSAWVGTDWFGLVDPPLSDRIIAFDGGSAGTWLFLHLGVAVFVASVALGALAERTTIVGHVVAAALIAGVVYPLAARAAWGQGLLSDIDIGGARFADAGGGGVVSALAGWLGLTGAMLVGPRLGRFGSTGQARVIPGRSIPLMVLGSLIVSVGWIGFIGGLPGAWSDDLPSAAVSMLVSAAAASLSAMAISWRRSGRAGSLSAARGLVAGLVAVSAGVDVVSPASALAIGAIAGVVVISAAVMIERARVDDPLGVVAMFGVCGVWSVVAVGLFAERSGRWIPEPDAGLLFGGGTDQLAAQALGILIVCSWAIVAGTALFGLLRVTGLLRIRPEEELVGLGLAEQHRSGAELGERM